MISDTYLSLSAPLQHACPLFLRSAGRCSRSFYAASNQILHTSDESLARQRLVSRLEIEEDRYAVLRVPAVQSDEDLAIRLLEQRGVLVQPGHFYEFPEDGYLIVSLLTSSADFEKGIAGLLACVAG